MLLGEGADDRKVWIENRLRELAEIFAASVGSFAVLDNHPHLLLRLFGHEVGAAADDPVRPVALTSAKASGATHAASPRAE